MTRLAAAGLALALNHPASAGWVRCWEPCPPPCFIPCPPPLLPCELPVPAEMPAEESLMALAGAPLVVRPGPVIPSGWAGLGGVPAGAGGFGSFAPSAPAGWPSFIGPGGGGFGLPVGHPSGLPPVTPTAPPPGPGPGPGPGPTPVPVPAGFWLAAGPALWWFRRPGSRP